MTTTTPIVSLSLSRYGDAGWEWTETTEHGTAAYRTDACGCGLWVWRRTSGWCVDRYDNVLDHSDPNSCGMCWQWKQVSGTAQFQLPANRRAAYSRIRRHALARLVW